LQEKAQGEAKVLKKQNKTKQKRQSQKQLQLRIKTNQPLLLAMHPQPFSYIAPPLLVGV
jgi:hypothetical protein